jgi:hypothetical protein
MNDMNDAPKPKRKLTWLWIVLGVLFVLFVVAVGGVFVAVSFFRQNFAIAEVSEANAAREFAEIRARFPGQEPLIRLVDGKPQYVADRASQTSSNKPLTTMHVIAFDEDENNLATFSLPFWLLRMKSGPIRLSAYSQGWDDRGVSFKIDDLEKAGPGIVVDVTRPREGRMLIWVE